MRLVIQRVTRAAVRVGRGNVAEIGPGLLILVGVGAGEEPAGPERLAQKAANLRIFEDQSGKMNLSVIDAGGEVLVVSQFTLHADLTKGRRPSWADAAEPAVAEPAVEAFARALEADGLRVGRGVFGAHMEVELVNDGPVTILLEG